MHRTLALAALTLTAGCALPTSATDQDHLAVDALRVAWYAHGRGYPPCAFTDSDFSVRPFRHQDDLDAWCGYPWGTHVWACTYGDEIGLMDGFTAHPRASLVIHEHVHALRACWVFEGGTFDVTRFNVGETSTCSINQANDLNHCDRQAFSEIAGHALALWGEWQ